MSRSKRAAADSSDGSIASIAPRCARSSPICWRTASRLGSASRSSSVVEPEPRADQRVGRDDPPEARLDGVVEALVGGTGIRGRGRPGQGAVVDPAGGRHGSLGQAGAATGSGWTDRGRGLGEGGARRGDGGLDVGRVHAVVRHRADLAVRVLDHQHAARPERLEERRAVAGHLEQHEVRPDPARVERSGGRLGGPAGGHDAVHPAERLGQPPGVGVVLGEAVDHAVRAVGEGDQAGRGEDPRLAHAAADHLPRPARAPDHVLRADDHRADRAGQALREAERDGVGRAGEVQGGHAGVALGHDGVPEPGAVDVERDAAPAGDRRDGLRVGGRQRLAHRMRVGVLDGDHPGDRLVRVRGVAERVIDLVEVEGAVGPVVEGADAGPHDDRVAGRLVDDHVMLAAGDGLLAARQMGHLGDEVAHRPRRDEQAGLLAEQLRGALLEGVHRGVVAEDVVADLGVGHRPAHGRRRLRDRVAAEVDEGHGRRV